MSILGYSSSYFLPQYWAGTPLYGEKIIPLLDYILSTDYVHTDQLATAFYNIESKYKNTADLPVEQIEAIIEECGYGYIRNLLGQDEESLKLLVYILVMIHQLKGSKKGIETVLNFLKDPSDKMIAEIVGDLPKTEENEVYGFSSTSYVTYSNLNSGSSSFELSFQIRTGDNFENLQCIASGADLGFYIGLDVEGHLVLKLGQKDTTIAGRSWQKVNGIDIFVSDRTLSPNTLYYIIFEFSGYEYSLRVSTDGKKYVYYQTVNTSTPLGISDGTMYLGIDHAGTSFINPFKGSMFLGPLTIASNNVKVTQWFEKYPVGDENTFEVESALDGELISAQFFQNFSNFVRNYVYPTLKAFKANLAIKGKMTFIPYVRSRVTYVASDAASMYENFMVEEENKPEEHIPYEVESIYGDMEKFKVLREDEN